MDTLNLMGLLGDPTITGTLAPETAPPQDVPTTGAGASGFGFGGFGGGGDPESQAYAELGIDPAAIEQQRWRHLGDLGMAAMIAGAPGVTADTAISYLKSLDPNQGVKDMVALKKHATDMALDRARLNLSQQELLMRQRAEQREQALNEALGLSLTPSDLSGGVGVGVGGGVPSIAQAAGIRPIPSGPPGGPLLQSRIGDLPGENGNPPLVVTGTGGGQPVETATATAPQQVAQAPLTAPQRTLTAPLNPLATARDVFAGKPEVLAKLGISPEQAAMLRVTAAGGPEGRKAAIAQIMSLSEKSRYTETSNDNGDIVLRDQYGNVSVQRAPTQAQILSLEQGKSDIQEMREMGSAQRQFEMDRKKAAEDAQRAYDYDRLKTREDVARAEETKAREAAMGLTNKGIEEAFKTATAAKDVLEKTTTAEELMRSGVFSGGKIAVSVGSAQAMLSRYGLWDNKMAEDTQARTVALQNLGREIALGLAKSMRPTTDKDMAMAERIAGLTPDQYDVNTIREVLRISRIGHERTINDYNSAAERARKPFEMSGDQRSLAAADAAYPRLAIPALAPEPAPTSAPASPASPAPAPAPTRKTINGRTFDHDGRGWYEVQ